MPDSFAPRLAVSQRIDVTSEWTSPVPRPSASASQRPSPSSWRSLPAAAAVIEVCVGAATSAVPCERVSLPDTHRHRRSTHQ
jgi:anti-sigma-K factor RskA